LEFSSLTIAPVLSGGGQSELAELVDYPNTIKSNQNKIILPIESALLPPSQCP
jgi:hypothetical protein